jgi:hypothetical protein
MVAVAVASAFFALTWSCGRNGSGVVRVVGIHRGRFVYVTAESPGLPVTRDWSRWELECDANYLDLSDSTMWWDSSDPAWRAGVLWERLGPNVGAGVSLVYPVLLTAIPAAFLWYKYRRRYGPHQCQKCGYDRAGLAADAKCPECGIVPTK